MNQQQFEKFISERKFVKPKLHTFKNWFLGLLFLFGIVAIIHWLIELL